MKITFRFFIIIIISIMIVGCKPDNLEIEIYTSDIESASEGEVVEVPLKATFRLMGEDKENQLPLAKKLALEYMPSDSEIEISKGTFGQVMTIVSSIPLGSKSALSKFLQKNPRIAMIVVENGIVKFLPTKTIKKLDNKEEHLTILLILIIHIKEKKFQFIVHWEKIF